MSLAVSVKPKNVDVATLRKDKAKFVLLGVRILRVQPYEAYVPMGSAGRENVKGIHFCRVGGVEVASSLVFQALFCLYKQTGDANSCAFSASF